MVGRGRGDDVALTGDLAGEAGDGAGYCRGVWFDWVSRKRVGNEETRGEG